MFLEDIQSIVKNPVEYVHNPSSLNKGTYDYGINVVKKTNATNTKLKVQYAVFKILKGSIYHYRKYD